MNIQISKILINIIFYIIEILDKHYQNSDEKLVESFDVSDIRIKTDTGWSQVTQIHKTKPFEIYHIKTNKGLCIDCADNHIFYNEQLQEKFAKDFSIGDNIMTEYGVQQIAKIIKYSNEVCMCDISLNDMNHRYYSNHILSHNTTSSAIFMLHYILFNTDKNALILGNIRNTAVEILQKVKDIYDPLPWFLKPGVMKWNEGEIVLDNKCRIIIGATTKNAGVSFTIHCALLDEFAKIAPNIQEPFYTHVLPTITAGKARIMITSTQNGVELFCKLYTSAVAGENEYAPFKTDWWEVPEWDEETKSWKKRDEKWHQMQIANYGSVEAFEMQFGTSFLSGSGTLISNKFISAHKRENVLFVPSDQITTTNGHYFLWHPEYADGDLVDKLRHDWFVITIDIAEGHGGDYTVFNFNRLKPRLTDDTELFECVGHFLCNEKDIPECSRALYDFCRTYLNQYHHVISVEYNTYGSLFIKYITDWIDKEDPDNFSSDNFAKYYYASTNKTTIGIRIGHKDKLKFCSMFKSDFERRHIINNSLLFNNELTAFVDVKGNGVYKASFGHDDLVMAQIQLEATKDTLQYKQLIQTFDDQNGAEELAAANGNLYNVGLNPYVEKLQNLNYTPRGNSTLFDF